MIECKKQYVSVLAICDEYNVASIRSLRSMDRSFQARSFHLILHTVIPLRDLQLRWWSLCLLSSNFIFILTFNFPTAFPWWYLNKASKLQTSLRNNEFCTCTDCFLIFSIIITSTDNCYTLQCSKKTRQAKTWVSFLSTVQLMICWEPYALCSVD